MVRGLAQVRKTNLEEEVEVVEISEEEEEVEEDNLLTKPPLNVFTVTS